MRTITRHGIEMTDGDLDPSFWEPAGPLPPDFHDGYNNPDHYLALGRIHDPWLRLDTALKFAGACCGAWRRDEGAA